MWLIKIYGVTFEGTWGLIFRYHASLSWVETKTMVPKDWAVQVQRDVGLESKEECANFIGPFHPLETKSTHFVIYQSHETAIWEKLVSADLSP